MEIEIEEFSSTRSRLISWIFWYLLIFYFIVFWSQRKKIGSFRVDYIFINSKFLFSLFSIAYYSIKIILENYHYKPITLKISE